MAKDEGKDEKKIETETENTEKVDTKVADSVPSPADKGPAYSGKNSVLKWVLIYIVIGVVIYGAWYYFSVSRDTTSTDSQTSSSYQ